MQQTPHVRTKPKRRTRITSMRSTGADRHKTAANPERPQAASGLTCVEHTIEPVWDERSRILMLGTMPSPKSRELGFYYGHPQNRFWPVMAHVLGEAVPQTIREKKEMVLAHHVALWDVLASCRISGASDGSIQDASANDLSLITSGAPIEAIFCTGAKAAELYGKLCERTTKIPCVRLPSTSPANAAWSLARLIDAYAEALAPWINDAQ